MARLHQALVASVAAVSVSGLLLAPLACQMPSSDPDRNEGLRSDEDGYEDVLVTVQDIENLEPGQMLVLDLDADALYEVEAEVWTESSDRIMVTDQDAEMTVEQWVSEAQQLAGPLDGSQSLLFSGDAARFGISDQQSSILEQNNALMTEELVMLCLPCGYMWGVPS